jgi:hypothetical protein
MARIVEVLSEHAMKLLWFRRGMAFPGDPPTDIHS